MEEQRRSVEWTQLEWRQTLAVLVLYYWAFIDIAVSSSLIVEVLVSAFVDPSSFLIQCEAYTVSLLTARKAIRNRGEKVGQEDGGVVVVYMGCGLAIR